MPRPLKRYKPRVKKYENGGDVGPSRTQFLLDALSQYGEDYNASIVKSRKYSDGPDEEAKLKEVMHRGDMMNLYSRMAKESNLHKDAETLAGYTPPERLLSDTEGYSGINEYLMSLGVEDKGEGGYRFTKEGNKAAGITDSDSGDILLKKQRDYLQSHDLHIPMTGPFGLSTGGVHSFQPAGYWHAVIGGPGNNAENNYRLNTILDHRPAPPSSHIPLISLPLNPIDHGLPEPTIGVSSQGPKTGRKGFYQFELSNKTITGQVPKDYVYYNEKGKKR